MKGLFCIQLLKSSQFNNPGEQSPTKTYTSSFGPNTTENQSPMFRKETYDFDRFND